MPILNFRGGCGPSTPESVDGCDRRDPWLTAAGWLEIGRWSDFLLLRAARRWPADMSAEWRAEVQAIPCAMSSTFTIRLSGSEREGFVTFYSFGGRFGPVMLLYSAFAIEAARVRRIRRA